MIIALLTSLLISIAATAPAEKPADEKAMQHSLEELRGSVGRWAVVTEFLEDDGSVAKSVTGSYEFAWAVPDKVISGRSEIPELKQISAILFYINEKKREIEMVSVGADGKLWIMTGPVGGDQRLSQEYKTGKGGTAQLRFTRSSILADSFESRMEYTSDGGKTWLPGNHQTFRRETGTKP